MTSAIPRSRVAVIVTALFLWTASLHADDVQTTVDRFVRLAYAGRFAELNELSAPDAAGRKAFEKQIRNALRVRCIDVEGIELTASGDDSAEVVVALRTNIPDTVELIPLRLRVQDRKISAIEFPDQQLVAALIAANDEERERLLATNEPHLTKNLVRTFYQRLVPLLLQQDMKAVVPLAKFNRRLAILAGDRGGEALALAPLAIAARLSGKRDEGMRLARESVAIAEESGDPLARTRALITIGRATASLDELDPMVQEYYRRALEAAKDVDDPSVYIRALAQLADDALARRDLFTVRKLSEEGLRRIAESGDPLGDLRSSFALNITQVYFGQGDFEQSLIYADRAVSGLEGTNLYNYAVALLHKARALRSIGRAGEAREVLSKVMNIAPDQADKHVIAGALDESAILAAKRGDFEEAECLLRDAARYYRGMGYATPGGFELILPSLVGAKKYRDALRLALEEAQEERRADQLAPALTAAAEAYRGLGDRKRAMSTILEAIETAESFHARVAGSEEQRIRAAEPITASYELAGDLALENGDVAQALAFIDRGRARVLGDIVENGRPSLDSELDHAERAARDEHERQLANLNVELARADANGDTRKVAELRARLDDARRTYESFIDGVTTRHLRREMTRPHMTSPEEIMRVPEGLTTIVYAIRDAQLHIFVARRNTPIVHRTVAIRRATIEERVRRFMAMMHSGDLRYRADARELYALLLAPVEKQIATAGVLCIVPDESLWQVPFAALVDRGGHFVVERSAVVYAPSMGVYSAITTHRRSTTSGGRVLAVANPTMERGVTKQIAALYRDVHLGPLPDAEREADVICAMYRSDHCLALKRNRATEARTKSAMQGPRILHFATHGLIDDRNPMYSRLLLARGGDANEDGSLEAWEVTRLNLNADLVVLSACDTARGNGGGGEGVVGMTWAFFIAGGRSTIATQWKVNSMRTADLMIAFHRQFGSGRNRQFAKARALRAAQLGLLHSPATRHPFYWAAFVLLGDPT